MQITFDTENLTKTDREILALVLGDAPAVVAAPAKAVKPAPAKAASVAEPEPVEEEPAAEENLIGDEPDEDLLSVATALATDLVSQNKAAEVKVALAKVDAARVSGVAASDLPEFIQLLKAVA